MKKGMLFALSLVLTSTCYAGSYQTGVTTVGLLDANWAVIGPTTPIPAEVPACVTLTSIAFDNSTSYGREMLALAMTAFATGGRLIVTYSDSECGYSGRLLATRFVLTH